MEVTGKLTKIYDTKTYGESGFRKREVVLTTDEQYPQPLLIEFVQDKCDVLNSYKVDDIVKISINMRGREWKKEDGSVVYFNYIQGWRIDNLGANTGTQERATTSCASAEQDGDLPF